MRPSAVRAACAAAVAYAGAEGVRAGRARDRDQGAAEDHLGEVLRLGMPSRSAAWTRRMTGNSGRPTREMHRPAGRPRGGEGTEAAAAAPRGESCSTSPSAPRRPARGAGRRPDRPTAPGSRPPPATSADQFASQGAEASEDGEGEARPGGGPPWRTSRTSRTRSRARRARRGDPGGRGRAGRWLRHRRSGSGWTTATGILADQRRSVAYQRLPAGPSRHCGPMQSLISRVTVRPSAYGSCEPGRRTVPSVFSRCSSTVRKMPDWARAVCSSRTRGRQIGIVGPVSCTRWSVSQRSVAGRRTGSHHWGAAPSRAIRWRWPPRRVPVRTGRGTLRLRGRRAR